jgi:hypothetical protein
LITCPPVRHHRRQLTAVAGAIKRAPDNVHVAVVLALIPALPFLKHITQITINLFSIA